MAEQTEISTVFRRQIGFWLILLAALIVVLWALGGILLPFVAGMILAYFLDPVVDRLEDRNVSRLWATILIVGMFLLAFVLALIFLLPLLIDQIGSFAGKLPAYVQDLAKRIHDAAPEWVLKEIEARGVDMKGPLSDLAAKAAGWLATLLQSMLSGGLALVNLVALLVVTPVVTFYVLIDWDRMVAKVDGWVPREHVETVRRLADEADLAIAGFVRGQGTVCLILGLIYAAALTLVGLDFGLLIGLGAGLLSFVPFVGAVVGGLASVGMAVVQFWPDWMMVAVVAAIFAGGQFLEGNFLTPKLIGNNVGLHPVWLMFALFAAGYLFGFVGLLVAVPVAAAIGVLIRFALEKYMESPLYRGEGGEEPVFAPVATSRVKRRAEARSDENDDPTTSDDPTASDDPVASDDSPTRARKQLALELAFRPAMSREDFMVSPSNEEAVRGIDGWPDWKDPSLLLVGPEGSGKSHLAEVFRMRAGGTLVASRDLCEAEVPNLLAGGACVVEDLPGDLSGGREVALFHMLNMAKETGAFVLMTSRVFPARWNVTLPDLASRLAAVPTVAMGSPCDMLLRGLLVKLFSDKQIAVDESVIGYLVRNMERSGNAAIRLVDRLDRGSLEEKSSVTRRFAAKALAELSAAGEAD